MKIGIPDDSGLPSEILASSLIHRDEHNLIQLTDIQYAALEADIARGKNILAVAPTSSGKTDIGLFAAASWLHGGIIEGKRVVFLTSHRALARQKFSELRMRFAPLFGLTPSEIVLATGDDVIDANGDPVLDAFPAPILIATYEKYLHMLAGSGLQAELSDICFIADEIQIIGDATRGQSVEILMTLLRRTAGQIVGLSAVLETRYARLLADWLHAKLVQTGTREVELIYELRSPTGTYRASSNSQEAPDQQGPLPRQTIDILRELIAQGTVNEPIAVFCMTKKQVFELAEAWSSAAAELGFGSVSDAAPLFREQTTSSEELELYIPKKFAYHTADLNEDERIAVETRLDNGSLRVVFATTTLASGLNYSFKTVIIHTWSRWDQRQRRAIPIPRSEFHNMAGRAGRLSHVDTAGRVIFSANDAIEARAAGRYLTWWELDEFSPRINPATFSSLTLQLLASGVVSDEESLSVFLQGTFSAERELERNSGQPLIWREAISRSVADLKNWGFVV